MDEILTPRDVNGRDIELGEMRTGWLFFCCGLFLLKQNPHNWKIDFGWILFSPRRRAPRMSIRLTFAISPAIKENGLYVRAQPVSRGLSLKAADGIPKFNLLFDLSLCYHSECLSNAVRKHKPKLRGLSCNLMQNHPSREWTSGPIHNDASLWVSGSCQQLTACIGWHCMWFYYTWQESNTRYHQKEEFGFGFVALICN